MTISEQIDAALNNVKQATGQGLFDTISGAIKSGLENQGVKVSNVTPQPASAKQDTIVGIDSKIVYVVGALGVGFLLFKKFGKRRV